VQAAIAERDAIPVLARDADAWDLDGRGQV